MKLNCLNLLRFEAQVHATYPAGSASHRCTSAFEYIVHRSDSFTGLGALPELTSLRQLSRLIGTNRFSVFQRHMPTVGSVGA